MDDIVEAALANADGDRAAGEADDAVDVSEFGPVRIAVVGVGEHGRERLDHVRSVADAWHGTADQPRTGVAPVEAPASAPLRAHPAGSVPPDLDAADVVVATAHVHSAADVERLRRVADRARPDAVTVALPTLSAETSETAATVASELLARCDAAVPLAAERVPDSPVAPLEGGAPGDRDPVDAVAGAVAVALVEGLPVGAHRPLTAHVPVLSLLTDAGRGRAHLGTAGPDDPPEAVARAAVDGPLADLDGGRVAGVVTHLLAADDVTLSAAEAFGTAAEDAVGDPGGEAVPHYVGVQPALADGRDRRAVLVAFEGA